MNTNNNIPPYAPPTPPPFVPPAAGRQTKNKFWTVFWSFIPGAGQMYHGLMKRGISLMVLFAGIIAVAAFTYLAPLIFLLPVIWFYSFFDTINRINMPLQELRLQPDEFVFLSEDTRVKIGRDTVGRFVKKRHMLLGWALVIFSVWLCLKMLFSNSYYSFSRLLSPDVMRVIRDIINVLPSLLIPIACIFFGIRLIVGKKEPVYDEYTIPGQEKSAAPMPSSRADAPSDGDPASK